MSRYNYLRDGAEIYRRSFATIRAEADLARFARDEEHVAVRIIHACGMVEIAGDLVFSNGAVAQARSALRQGAPILCDSKMLARGIIAARLPKANEVICTLEDPVVPSLAQSSQRRAAPPRSNFGATNSMARSSSSAMRQPLCFIFSTCSIKPQRGLPASLECRSALSARRNQKTRSSPTPACLSSPSRGERGAVPWPRLP